MIILRFNNGQPIIGTASKEILERLTINEVARVVVPEREPFWIVSDDELPEDRTFIDAIDPPHREPDGYGSPLESFSEVLND